ncbi:unnamed protein product [Polarella glacialis]|uniref:Uncharacterized protein n=1 Tax=Polarella glacialis TaxID=89957 RepID=A0A813E4T3_POLGL|nr:unnamed protein product [Polarella glacialis]
MARQGTGAVGDDEPGHGARRKSMARQGSASSLAMPTPEPTMWQRIFGGGSQGVKIKKRKRGAGVQRVFRPQEEGQYDPADFKAASQQADLHSQQVSGSFTPMQVRNLLWMPQVELADQIPWQQTSYHGTWHETTISHGLNPSPQEDRSRTQLSLPAGEDRSRRQLSLPGGVT